MRKQISRQDDRWSATQVLRSESLPSWWLKPPEQPMSQIITGSFVVHAKRPELGRGEVLWAEKGTVRLRFASGERSFLIAFASEHLSVVMAGPAPRPPARSAKRSRKAPVKPSALES